MFSHTQELQRRGIGGAAAAGRWTISESLAAEMRRRRGRAGKSPRAWRAKLAVPMLHACKFTHSSQISIAGMTCSGAGCSGFRRRGGRVFLRQRQKPRWMVARQPPAVARSPAITTASTSRRRHPILLPSHASRQSRPSACHLSARLPLSPEQPSTNSSPGSAAAPPPRGPASDSIHSLPSYPTTRLTQEPSRRATTSRHPTNSSPPAYHCPPHVAVLFESRPRNEPATQDFAACVYGYLTPTAAIQTHFARKFLGPRRVSA